MFQGVMSNSSLSHETNINNNNNNINNNPLLLQNTSNIVSSTITQEPNINIPPKRLIKKKRNLPGNPDPDAEVIALSPKSLLATNRFLCEICNKGFQRDQNLQLHRRGHNLPWKLKQRNKSEIVRKKAYVCPEPSCVHHHPSRALGDLTGIKKHFCRKHGEKKFKCEKCSKIYAVHSDWKAHSKICGTREYRCDCGTLFSRKDSFITHRAFCDALTEESARLSTNPFSNPMFPPPQQQQPQPMPPLPPFNTQNPSHYLFPFPSSSLASISLSSSPWDQPLQNPNNLLNNIKTEINHFSTQSNPQTFFQPSTSFPNKGMMLSSPPFTSDTNAITAHFLSATALLQKATEVGATLQQSQQSQQATMLNGFSNEQGPSFHPLESPTSTTTATRTTTTSDNNDYYNNHNMGTSMSMSMSMSMKQGSLGTWRKNDEDTTRDFLGLTNRSDQGGFDEDDMLKFTGGLPYAMTVPYDRHNLSPPSSSSSLLLRPHHLIHDQGSFGNFVTSDQGTTGATLESRWG